MKKLIILLLVVISGCSQSTVGKEISNSTLNIQSQTKTEIDAQKEAELKHFKREESKFLKANTLDDCESIKNNELKDSCEFNTVTNFAISKNDKSLCNQISNKQYAILCKSNVQTNEPQS